MWAYHKQFCILPSMVILIFHLIFLLYENFPVIIPITLSGNQLEPIVF
jgi:hypothetical protein